MMRGRILAAMLAVMALPVLASESLTQQQLSQQLIGKQPTATRMGVNLRLRYLADGTVTLKLLLAQYAGTWEFDGNSICMEMRGGPRKGRNCVTFTALGGNKFLNSEGVTMTVQK